MKQFHIGRGQSDVQPTRPFLHGCPACRTINGLIVVKINGEGRGVSSRVVKPIKKT